jgi:hypothetical protein
MGGGDMKMRWLIANHMKKSYLSWKGYREDDVIYEHLYELSDGKINMLDSAEHS